MGHLTATAAVQAATPKDGSPEAQLSNKGVERPTEIMEGTRISLLLVEAGNMSFRYALSRSGMARMGRGRGSRLLTAFAVDATELNRVNRVSLEVGGSRIITPGAHPSLLFAIDSTRQIFSRVL